MSIRALTIFLVCLPVLSVLPVLLHASSASASSVPLGDTTDAATLWAEPSATAPCDARGSGFRPLRSAPARCDTRGTVPERRICGMAATHRAPPERTASRPTAVPFRRLCYAPPEADPPLAR